MERLDRGDPSRAVHSLRVDTLQRFVREGLAAGAVKHPGIVAFLENDVAEDGSGFLVMELLEGKSVEQLCTESGGRLPPQAALAIAAQVCDALDAAHRAGIVHRDIKPANLLITAGGALKVLDFGIARVRAFASTRLTGTGTILGTPAFLAPEQANGSGTEIDERTDVWAVGGTLFMLLSGEPVHEASNAAHAAILAATKPARSVAEVVPELPRPIVDLIDRALVTDKAARWPSAAAFRDAIRAASVTVYGRPDLPLVVSESQNATVPLGESPAERVRIQGNDSEVSGSMPTVRAPPIQSRTEPLMQAPVVSPPESSPIPASTSTTAGRHPIARGLLVVAIIAMVISGSAVLWKWRTGGRPHGPARDASARRTLISTRRSVTRAPPFE
jgi:serine/threonine-protein kinase